MYNVCLVCSSIFCSFKITLVVVYSKVRDKLTKFDKKIASGSDIFLTSITN